ncbi:hypothetical protein GP486_001304 [Trichoglossum hirsutum]|uniref:Uncharacterized protein n=1 Tax=Trichoglossum hirsutum TaxID=265104 RepID=A0A9P8LH39_9PEZI|nr:hypothetical protein GP486_001304 [Trichoglossum hirsutum]
MLLADCESINSGGQRRRSSRVSKCATANRQSTSESSERGNPSASSSASISTDDNNADDDDDDNSEEIGEDDEEESEAIAPSGELKSKNKEKCSTSIQPTIVVGSTSDPPGGHDVKVATIHQMGLNSNDFRPQKPILRNSILQEDDGDSVENNGLGVDYPRKKSVRRLSNNNGFLAYGEAGVGSDQEESIPMQDKKIEAAGSSDDEYYKGVDLISDSEEDEPCVEEAEARVIIDSEEEAECHSRIGLSINRSGTALSGRVSDWGDFDVDDGLLLDDIPLFNQQYAHLDHILGHDVSTCNRARSPGNIPERPSASRHVRFEDDTPTTDSTSSSTSDDDDEVFPDLFLDQDRLDPLFRRMIENDNEMDEGFGFGSEDGSYWDFRGSDDFDQVANGGDDSSDTGDSIGSSSGYESDEGETTDEDLPPPPTITPTRSVLRRMSASSLVGDSESTRTFFQRSLNQASRPVGPSMGSWIADPSKPIAFIDSTGKRMLILPATQPAPIHSNQFGPPGSSDSSIIGNSPPTAFSTYIDDSEGEYSSQDFGVAVEYSGRNLMMGGLLHGAPGSEFILGGQVLGSPEAFYPFTSVGPSGLMDGYDDDLEDEDLWSVSDFIDFGGGSSCSDNDDDQDTEVPTSPTTTIVANQSSLHSTPLETDNIANGRDTTQSMISHFDKGVVGAFHRNQQRHRQLLARPEPRAFSPSMSAVLHGIAIKGGRQAAANCPITPIRKRKAEHVFGATPNGNPLASNSSKRRMLNAHKRSKSAF